MATRPVFVPRVDRHRVDECAVDFAWVPGMAKSQAQKCIRSLHAAAQQQLKVDSVLEISSRSEDPDGVSLSAFNLALDTVVGPAPLECVYQGSKVFERGGPFTELLSRKPAEARADERLKTSGRLVGFKYGSEWWELEPKTCFYDWLYLSALKNNPVLAKRVISVDAFTDIAFNPEKSLSCQARSAALFAVLVRTDSLGKATTSQNAFISANGQALRLRPIAPERSLFAAD